MKAVMKSILALSSLVVVAYSNQLHDKYRHLTEEVSIVGSTRPQANEGIQYTEQRFQPVRDSSIIDLDIVSHSSFSNGSPCKYWRCG
jgi:hypothetical protein